MKNVLTLFILSLMLAACGASSSSKETTKSEETITEELIEKIDSQKKELNLLTQETLTEVDSLLESL
jgi:uncharacterized protein YcfL